MQQQQQNKTNPSRASIQNMAKKITNQNQFVVVVPPRVRTTRPRCGFSLARYVYVLLSNIVYLSGIFFNIART